MHAEALMVLDGEGHLTCMSPAAERMLDWTAEQLRGRRVLDVIHRRRPGGPPERGDDCPLALVRGQGAAARAVRDAYFRRDGELLPVMWWATPLPDGGVVILFREPSAGMLS
jgi:two-component system, sensor histidine kinase and response regulator